MGIYSLAKSNKEGTHLRPTNTFYSDEYAQEHCDFYLKAEFHNDEKGRVHKCYRLHSQQPHNIEMALAYDIKCPNCSAGMLKQIGRCVTSHELGLYRCPICDKK